uniref:Uncharacterized protein n=1 Tax=Solanum tuberosum TaxID=4113 RepID=M1DB16_SOLTU
MSTPTKEVSIGLKSAIEGVSTRLKHLQSPIEEVSTHQKDLKSAIEEISTHLKESNLPLKMSTPTEELYIAALDSDDFLYLKEQMEAEEDAEHLLRRTEKRGFQAF